MGYAEVYRKRMRKGPRALRALILVSIILILLYFSIRILGTQPGSMIGGAPVRQSDVGRGINK